MDHREARHTRRLVDRRTFLGTSLAATAFGALGRPGRAFAGDLNSTTRVSSIRSPGSRPRRHLGSTAGSTVDVNIVAAPGEIEVGPGVVYRTWLYNEQFPGPVLRLTEGDRLRVTLANELPEETTVHWHGVPVPNVIDGVPGVTQAPAPQRGSFLYNFVAHPAGTYMYHSHVGLQLDRGLVGALVVEERASHVAYDRDDVVVVDDFLPVGPAIPAGGGMMGGATFDFVAANPGDWFFHCHDAYHMEMGMARVVRYV
jgi:multicopper oxidase